MDKKQRLMVKCLVDKIRTDYGSEKRFEEINHQIYFYTARGCHQLILFIAYKATIARGISVCESESVQI
jgi:hypothetical protein